jgi:hypothetical protein
MGTKVHQIGPATGGPTAETPSATIIRTAVEADTASHTDIKGRVIEVRRVTLLQMFRLTEVLGESASNPTRLNLAMSACSVTAIDGEKVSFPGKLSELEIIFQRLDFYGVAAAAEALKKLGIGGDVDEAVAKN